MLINLTEKIRVKVYANEQESVCNIQLTSWAMIFIDVYGLMNINEFYKGKYGML